MSEEEEDVEVGAVAGAAWTKDHDNVPPTIEGREEQSR